MKILNLCALDNHQLVVEAHPGYVNIWVTTKDGREIDLRLGSGPSKELKDLLNEATEL